MLRGEIPTAWAQVEAANQAIDARAKVGAIHELPLQDGTSPSIVPDKRSHTAAASSPPGSAGAGLVPARTSDKGVKPKPGESDPDAPPPVEEQP
jgi:hypothetical protein